RSVEGSFPKVNVKLRPETYRGKMPPRGIKLLSEFYKQFVKLTYVNCWHISQHQSAAMWKIYLQSNEGIAIRSTCGKLKESLKKDTSHELHIGKVKYISYVKDVIPEGSLFPYFHKRMSFDYEKELRAVIQAFSYDKDANINWSKSPYRAGLNVPVDLDILIDHIILTPSCSSWLKEVVKSVLSKYNLKKPVRKSLLYVKDERIVY
ncbi:unnamed protein product, partial [marine sediment metagenome]